MHAHGVRLIIVLALFALRTQYDIFGTDPYSKSHIGYGSALKITSWVRIPTEAQEVILSMDPYPICDLSMDPYSICDFEYRSVPTVTSWAQGTTAMGDRPEYVR